VIWLVPLAVAAPFRGPLPKPPTTVWVPGRSRDEVVVKVVEGAVWRPADGEPYFVGDVAAVEARAPGVASLGQYWRVRAADGDGAALATRLNARPEVELAYLRPEPAPPPGGTPDFTDQQVYLDVPLDGLGFTWARAWPGGDGAGVRIADVEYGVDTSHEDLTALAGMQTLGFESGDYLFHGNSVWGQLVGADNGFGVTGMVPAATPVMVYPYLGRNDYDVAGAILAAIEILQPGDVLLIEQQAYCPDGTGYCPVSSYAATFDAISAATAAGIVVVEPAANSGIDLDDASWEGWFDRAKQDSGAILVGGGHGPDAASPRGYAGGSGYGSRVDLQGWWSGIVTATSGEYSGYYADLYYPDGDGARAYTQSFGGTSGASPMVAAAAVVLQGVSLSATGEPMSPGALRDLLVSTGNPQPEGDAEHIGPAPDVRRALRVLLP